MKHIATKINGMDGLKKGEIPTDQERHAQYTKRTHSPILIGDMVEFRNSALSRLKIIGRVIDVTPKEIVVKTSLKFSGCDNFTIKRESIKKYEYQPKNSAKNS